MVIPVYRFMPDVLAGILSRAPLSPDKIAFAWRTAVGPSVDRVTTIDLRDHTLHVRAKDATWQREIERSAALIRARLDALLGDGIVRFIEVEPVKGSALPSRQSP
jgi:hypothetical protein